MKGFTGGLPLLVDAAPNGGFLNADSDSDGVLRRIPLLVRDGQEAGPSYYPSLSLAMYLATRPAWLGTPLRGLAAIADRLLDQPA